MLKINEKEKTLFILKHGALRMLNTSLKVKEFTKIYRLQAVKTYDLQPINEKSFYGKAKIHVFKNGDEVLQSYDTLIIRRKKSGKLIRLWDDWSVTTGRHIKAFCGLNKAEYNKLPLAK